MNSVAKAKHENESHALRVQGKTDRLFYYFGCEGGPFRGYSDLYS